MQIKCDWRPLLKRISGTSQIWNDMARYLHLYQGSLLALRAGCTTETLSIPEGTTKHDQLLDVKTWRITQQQFNHFRCPYGPDFCRWNGTQLFDDGCVFSKTSPFWGPKSKAAQQFRPSFSVSGRCGAERISVTWELPIWTGADPRRQLLAFFTCSWSRVIKILMPCKSTLVGPGTWAKVAVEGGTSGQTFLIWHSISLSQSLSLSLPELHIHSNPTCVSLLEAMCIYIYIHTYIHTSMHAYIHTYLHYIHTLHTYIHTCMHACMHAYMHTCIHAYMHTCIHAYIHTYITLHYIRYITLHYVTLRYVTLHTYIALHYTTLHHITLHYIALHCITLHYIHTYLHVFAKRFAAPIEPHVRSSAPKSGWLLQFQGENKHVRKSRGNGSAGKCC